MSVSGWDVGFYVDQRPSRHNVVGSVSLFVLQADANPHGCRVIRCPSLCSLLVSIESQRINTHPRAVHGTPFSPCSRRMGEPALLGVWGSAPLLLLLPPGGAGFFGVFRVLVREGGVCRRV